MDTDSTSPPMTHALSLHLPMNRNGSGTAWLPDVSPIYAYMAHSDRWMYMVHGNIFVRYNWQDVTERGTRGDRKLDAPNWFMFMGQRRIRTRGLFRFNTMFSLDPLFGADGYPLLFQSGETFEGEPLVDRQHPHDLVSELSISYTYAVSRNLDIFGYVAYPGEPALGPVAFMHRPSSLNNPDAPLGHHWQDATHITFGVATIGFRYGILKVDASTFTGREPDEKRYAFDQPMFDSYSYRISLNPFRNLAFQFSNAFITSPERAHPAEDVLRTTASVVHAAVLPGEHRNINSTVAWGYNDRAAGQVENSLLLESNFQLNRFAVYGRAEWVEKSAEELALEEYPSTLLFDIMSLTLGANYTLWRQWNTNFTLGAQGSVFEADDALDPIYGDHPLSAEVYLRISPALLGMR